MFLQKTIILILGLQTDFEPGGTHAPKPSKPTPVRPQISSQVISPKHLTYISPRNSMRKISEGSV